MSSTKQKLVPEGSADEKITAERIAKPVKLVQLIYCGPNLPQGILNQFTTYRGGLPKHLETHFEKCPVIKLLFVPVSELTKVQQSVKESGSPENIWFNEILGYIQGGAK